MAPPNGSEMLDFTSSLITILVGEEGSDDQKKFVVHESVLRKSSAFFDKALSHDWKEAKDKEIKLPEDEASTFALYLHWLYTKKIATVEVTTDNGDDYVSLGKAYILGDKLQDVDFRDTIIDEICTMSLIARPNDDGTECKVFPGNYFVALIYAETPNDSPMRRMLADVWVYFGRMSWLDVDRSPDDLPRQFLLDVVTATFARSEPEEAKGGKGEGAKKAGTSDSDLSSWDSDSDSDGSYGRVAKRTKVGGKVGTSGFLNRWNRGPKFVRDGNERQYRALMEKDPCRYHSHAKDDRSACYCSRV